MFIQFYNLKLKDAQITFKNLKNVYFSKILRLKNTKRNIFTQHNFTMNENEPVDTDELLFGADIR